MNVILNLILPEEIEDEETPELTANDADEAHDEEEWARIKRTKEKDLEDAEGENIAPVKAA